MVAGAATSFAELRVTDGRSGGSVSSTIDTTSGNQSAPPDDVAEVLDDYIAAWENQDVDGFRAVVTDDYALNEEILELDGPRHPLVADVDYAADGVEGTDYEVEFFGDMIVTGEGPWFVAVGETWIDRFNRLDGTANYVIVDEAGTLKISDHYWAGVRLPILDWQE